MVDCSHLIRVEHEVGERVGERGEAGYLGVLSVLMFLVVRDIICTDMEKSAGTSRRRFESLQWVPLNQLVSHFFGSHLSW